jgi:FtsH-binding integral membrane protein
MITHRPTLNALLVVVTASLVGLFSLFDSAAAGSFVPVAAAVLSAGMCAIFVGDVAKSLRSRSGSPRGIEQDPPVSAIRRGWREWVIAGWVVVCVAALIGEAREIGFVSPRRLMSLFVPLFCVFVVATRGVWLFRRLYAWGNS